MPPPPSLGSPEFERLLNRLAEDILDAANFNRLRAGVNASVEEYWREFNESRTFWSLSLQAFTEAVLYRLGRVYVDQERALTLGAWLKAINHNPQLFPTTPDSEQLIRDIASVGRKDPVVKKLTCLRGNFVAHINWEHTATGRATMQKGTFDLAWEEIDLLISRAAQILNRYSVLFSKTFWSMDIAGRDDYRDILTAVRSYLERLELDIAAEIERASSPS